MNALEKLEKAVSELKPEEIKAFAEWFAEFQSDRWERQIERDSNAGKLDKLIERALEDERTDRIRPL